MTNVINTLINNKLKVSRIVLIFIFVFAVISKFDSNLDIWFMLNHGRYIVQNGFTNIEPFTVHEGLTFQFEKWLTCVISWLVYDKFGMLGLNIIMYLLLAITTFIIFKLCGYFGNKTFLLPFIISMLYCMIFNQKRPHLISNICFLLEIYFLEKYIREDNYKYLFSLPLLFVIIINTHSTMALVFFMVMFPFIFTDFNLSTRLQLSGKLFYKKSLTIILFGLLSIIAGLLNPNGISAYEYMINCYLTAGSKLLTISELQKITIVEPFLGIILVLHLPILIKALKTEIVIPLRYLLLNVIFMLFSLFAIRNIQYDIIFSCVLLSYIFTDRPKDNHQLNLFISISLFIFIALLSVNSSKSIYRYNIFSQGIQDELHIVDTARLKEGSRIFNEYDLGSYYEFKGFRTYLDTRSEVFYKKINKKKDVIAEYYKISKGLITLDKVQKEYNFDYYHVYKVNALYRQLLDSQDWQIIAETKDTALFSRENPINYIKIGRYNGNLYNVDFIDQEKAQQIVDNENSCGKGLLDSGAMILADHSYYFFDETITNNILELWDEEGNKTIYKKVDTKVSKKGEWIAEDGTNIYSDYVSELVTQVCINDNKEIEWNFWKKEN